MICGVLFDFDGTLVDSNQCKTECFYEVVSGIPQSRAVMQSVLADPDIGDRYRVFTAFAERIFPADEAAGQARELARAYTQLTEERVGTAPKRAGTVAALEALRTMNIPLGISSATPRDALGPILDRQDLANFFIKVLGAPQSKSDHIGQFARLLGCSPSQLAYVGDSEIDRLAAARMGCTFVAVGDDTSRFADYNGDVMSDLSALPALIAATNAPK